MHSKKNLIWISSSGTSSSDYSIGTNDSDNGSDKDDFQKKLVGNLTSGITKKVKPKKKSIGSIEDIMKKKKKKSCFEKCYKKKT